MSHTDTILYAHAAHPPSPSQVNMLSHGVSILYSSFMNKKKVKDRMKKTMTAVVEEVTGKATPPEQKFLIFEVMCNDEDMEDVDMPAMRFFLQAP